ncbi:MULTISPECIES: hypothetical protein [Xanthomonas]|uniref:hypothetical protein n=1 Tax=Xanthomonas TaxID=338 RepID=UPI0020196AB0|nr:MULTISPECIES: hypothetical protein [Xanthomonas]MDO0852980.1 hypothetical protein [Xanthomonas campestris pv. campestris]MEB1908518.1 hypothetical protein [Xanthomonas campestris pv. campestris]UQQ14977.1 hypothetical protein KPG65_00100 [Xanthomonas arboricola pv. corylina]WDJ45784.1 hypothetical protein JH286_12705 [Xanthomonas campestris pv. campestris]
MIPEALKSRLKKERPMVSVTLRMPQDVIESLKEIAPIKGLSGYQALLKTYVTAGLRRDEAEYLFGQTARLAEALERRGVSPEVIKEAVSEVVEKAA